SELAGRCEQQQPFAVEIEPSYRDPFGAAKARHLVEDRGPPFRVRPADDLAGRLVIEQHPDAWRREAQPHQFAVDANLIGGPDLLSDFRRLAVDRDPAGNDQLFEPAQRTVAALSEHLVQALRLGEDGLSGTSGWFLVHR